MLTAFRKIGKCPTPRQTSPDFVIYCVALLEVVSGQEGFRLTNKDGDWVDTISALAKSASSSRLGSEIWCKRQKIVSTLELTANVFCRTAFKKIRLTSLRYNVNSGFRWIRAVVASYHLKHALNVYLENMKSSLPSVLLDISLEMYCNIIYHPDLHDFHAFFVVISNFISLLFPSQWVKRNYI